MNRQVTFNEFVILNGFTFIEQQDSPYSEDFYKIFSNGSFKFRQSSCRGIESIEIVGFQEKRKMV